MIMFFLNLERANIEVKTMPQISFTLEELAVIKKKMYSLMLTEPREWELQERVNYKINKYLKD